MTLSAIWALVLSYKDEASLGLFILIVVASLVQISAIKVYPFDWFLGIIGKKLNKEISDKVDNMRKELDQHIADDKKEKLEMGDTVWVYLGEVYPCYCVYWPQEDA